jgi:hypothetical protein
MRLNPARQGQDVAIDRPNPEGLRELAAWYREFAEKTENPWIWAARLRTAKALEAEARLVDGEGKPHSESPDLCFPCR